MNYKKIFLTILFPIFELSAFTLNTIANFTSKNSQSKASGLVIVKLDGIGDCILFRNFLQSIRNSKKYSSKKITFVGNIKFKDIVQELDNAFVDHFIWIDRDKAFKNFFLNRNIFPLLKELKKQSYKDLIFASYSRSYLDDCFIIRAINAPNKSTMVGDSLNTTSLIKKIYDCRYNQLIKIPPKCVFEFDRNRYFFQKILSQSVLPEQPTINNLPDNIIHYNQYVVLFPGASQSFRQWPTEYFAKIAKFIISEYGYKIVIAGSKTDKVLAKQIKQQAGDDNNITDITGKTSLLKLTAVINSSKLLISNDTSAVHIGASRGIQTIFFLVGNNEFGRFGPYPPRFKNMHALYPIDLNLSEENYSNLVTKYKTFPKMKISDITPERVIEIVTKVL